jgi:hypothetical protein
LMLAAVFTIVIFFIKKTNEKFAKVFQCVKIHVYFLFSLILFNMVVGLGLFFFDYY